MVLTDQLQTAKDSLTKATRELEIEKRKVCLSYLESNQSSNSILQHTTLSHMQSEDAIGKVRQRERIYSTAKGISTTQKALVSFKL